MQLSKCSGCDRLIDTQASTCVHCQVPQRRASWRAAHSGWIAPLTIAGLALGTCSGTARASTSTGADMPGSTGVASSTGAASSTGSTGSPPAESTTGDTTGEELMTGSGTDTDAATEHDTESYPPAEPHYGTSAWGCDIGEEDTPAAPASMLLLLLLAQRRRSRDA
ncbi:MAG: hypothetical protein ACRBN8_43480 [Nannocystales bacterium]